MYCKFCGKEIADDSLFCQYCGKQLIERTDRQSNGRPFQWFRSLSKGWQITLMVYSIWFMVGLCFLIGNSDNWHFVEEVLLPVLIVFVVLPVLALFIWYYFKRLRKPKAVDAQEDKKQPVSLSLMEFSKQHGKMQVKTMANPTTNEVRSYCVFINEQGKETKVEFGKALGVLRPQEIAEKKEQLIVIQQIDGSFELSER